MQLAMIGLGKMGGNMVARLLQHGHSVVGYARDPDTVAKCQKLGATPAKDLADVVRQLETPRVIWLMIPAGAAVDSTIDTLLPLLEKGDILIDGGNSKFTDSMAHAERLATEGIHFIDSGTSGGIWGLANGYCLMVGGEREAVAHCEPIFTALAPEGGYAHVGPAGAGHYVKMVHNGIEYGDMQLICEAYYLMKTGLGMSAEQMHHVFEEWNKGELDSYLIQITRDILAFKDTDGQPLVDKILDTAGQKGTGKWTVISSQELGIPITLMAEAVYSRCISALKDERVAASKKLKGPRPAIKGDQQKLVEDIRQALYASKIVSYAQGYMLMRAAAKEYGWNLNYGGIALMWRGGCIIRSAFLGKIKEAFDANQKLTNLMLDPFFKKAIKGAQRSWRNVVAIAAKKGIPVPAFSTALAFYDSYRSERLPANLLQAQRDYFGAHTYERLDQPRGQFFHTNWTGHGGTTASGSYTV